VQKEGRFWKAITRVENHAKGETEKGDADPRPLAGGK
jgi:hypothetical protein